MRESVCASSDDNKSTPGPPARQLYKGFWLKLPLITQQHQSLSIHTHTYTHMTEKKRVKKAEQRNQKTRHQYQSAERQSADLLLLEEVLYIQYVCVCLCVCETAFLLSDDLFSFPYGLAVAYLDPHASTAVFSFKAICCTLSYQRWPLARWPSWVHRAIRVTWPAVVWDEGHVTCWVRLLFSWL